MRHPIPSSTLDHLEEETLEGFLKKDETIEFADTLEDQMQGQTDAGFAVTGFYEDDFGGERMIDKYIKTFAATRAVKMDQMGILPK